MSESEGAERTGQAPAPAPRSPFLDRWLRLPWWGVFFVSALLIALLNRGPAEQPAPPPPLPAGPFFLVATDGLRDGVFDGTVLLVFVHGPQGAGGVVLNRLAAEASASQGELFWGGPVGIDEELVLSRRALPGSERIEPGLHLLLQPDLAHAALSLREEGVRVYRGYAGWSAGQLEREVAGGFWEVVPADPALAFAERLDTIRPAAAANAGRAPAAAPPAK